MFLCGFFFQNHRSAATAFPYRGPAVAVDSENIIYQQLAILPHFPCSFPLQLKKRGFLTMKIPLLFSFSVSPSCNCTCNCIKTV
jgi:hypothetical protein